ncbi:MAG TPA: PAS domain S-box protein, partial [Candidatus Acetothermia bacterium]|nr:PAS domain S-box protein [Candidatus Acetothermia bacterium]
MRLIIETSPDAIFSVDRQGRFLSVNPIITKELGYSRDELLSMNLGDVILPEHVSQFKARFACVLSGEVLDGPGEYEMVGKDGRRLWIAVNSAPLRKDGVVVGFLGIARDITELKRQMIELAMSEKRFRSVAESATDAIITSNDEGRIIFWNTAAQSIFGYTADEVIGRSAALLMPKRFRKAFADGVRRWRETGDSAFTGKRVVYLGLRKDGSEFPAEIAYSVWSVGDADFTTAIIRDITARVLAKKALRESYVRAQRTLNGIVKALESAIELRDPYTAGHQVRVAELATAIAKEMDLSPDRIHGIRYAALVHDIGKIAVPAETLAKPARLNPLEYSLIQTHPQRAYDILERIDFPWPIAEIVLQHHERMDGSGYPNGLKGDEILLEARIIAVADVVEAMASHRPYRPARGIDAALEEIKKNKGRLYDPNVVDACLAVFEGGFSFE